MCTHTSKQGMHACVCVRARALSSTSININKLNILNLWQHITQLDAARNGRCSKGKVFVLRARWPSTQIDENKLAEWKQAVNSINHEYCAHHTWWCSFYHYQCNSVWVNYSSSGMRPLHNRKHVNNEFAFDSAKYLGCNCMRNGNQYNQVEALRFVCDIYYWDRNTSAKVMKKLPKHRLKRRSKVIWASRYCRRPLVVLNLNNCSYSTNGW